MAVVRPRSAALWGIRAAWLVLALVAALYCAWRFAVGSPLQTDLLALLPATEADPVAEQAIATLASTLGDRTVFLVSSRDAAQAKAAARQFGAALTASGAFRSVTAVVPPFDVTQIARLYLPYRFGLLTAADRDALARDPANLPAMLQQHLYNPLRGGLTTALADDPFGWLEHWLAGLPLATSNLQLEDGLLVTHRGASTGVLVVTTLPGSAYDAQVQHAVEAAVAQGTAGLRPAFPDVAVARTGTVFYAQAARSAAEREVHVIGLGSLCGIALLMLLVLRAPRLLLLGFVSTALGIVCALAATLLIFGKLHLLTLVFGASLIGEAVDYSIQYFVVYLGTPGLWDPQQGARAVRPALTVALVTSLLGYAILSIVPFPALKQIACFASVGICTAFASVLWLLPALLSRAPKPSPRPWFAAAARGLTRWQALLGGRRRWLVAGLLVLLAIPGWRQLRSDDDIHLLIQRDARLVAEEQQVRDALGVDVGAQFFLVRGATPESVLQRTEALGGRLDAWAGAHRLAVGNWQAVTSFVPSAKQQAADHALLAQRVFDAPATVRATLLSGGFRAASVDAWLQAYTQSGSASLSIASWLAVPWSQPFRHLWLGQVGGAAGGYAAVLLPPDLTPPSQASLLAAVQAMPGVTWVDKAASVSRLFGAYRVDSGIWLVGALLLVLLLLMWRYRVRGGVAVMLPVVLAIGVTLAAFGYAQVPLNLFNWLALMLVLGVGANYAVFLREGCLRLSAQAADGFQADAGDYPQAQLGAVWTGVLLSAATTLLSFGLLGLSAMPALRSFGATLALGIAGAVLLAPMGMPALPRRAA